MSGKFFWKISLILWLCSLAIRAGGDHAPDVLPHPTLRPPAGFLCVHLWPSGPGHFQQQTFQAMAETHPVSPFLISCYLVYPPSIASRPAQSGTCLVLQDMLIRVLEQE